MKKESYNPTHNKQKSPWCTFLFMITIVVSSPNYSADPVDPDAPSKPWHQALLERARAKFSNVSEFVKNRFDDITKAPRKVPANYFNPSGHNWIADEANTALAKPSIEQSLSEDFGVTMPKQDDPIPKANDKKAFQKALNNAHRLDIQSADIEHLKLLSPDNLARIWSRLSKDQITEMLKTANSEQILAVIKKLTPEQLITAMKINDNLDDNAIKNILPNVTRVQAQAILNDPDFKSEGFSVNDMQALRERAQLLPSWLTKLLSSRSAQPASEAGAQKKQVHFSDGAFHNPESTSVGTGRPNQSEPAEGVDDGESAL